MPTESWKVENNIDWDDLDDDSKETVEHMGYGIEPDVPKGTNMKNIWIDSKIKKQKCSKELVDKIEWGSIKEIMSMDTAWDGYLSAYSDSEFFAYRYLKTHGFYPSMLRLRFVNSEKFLVDLFKYADIPITSYYKTYEDQRGDVKLNVALFAIETPSNPENKIHNQLYMYADPDEIVFYYDPYYEKDPDSVLHLLISLVKGAVEPKVKKNKIYVVYQSQNGFDKQAFDVKKINVDLKDNYNDGFASVSEEIIKGLNDKKKTNLVILEGPPGTGKTTYIRYLTSKIKKNIIFIAPDMVNHITDPSFIPFLIKNNDAVLIIEDAEPALQSRDGNGRTGAVSNVLNLTDGLLSDCLNISIVATFNTRGKDIDPALLRKGRLLKNYHFEKLSIEKSKALLKKLGREDVDVKEPMALSDIYYYGEENNSEKYERRKIGFGN